MYVLDLRKELQRAKARPDMFAFAGFAIAPPGTAPRRGVLTVTRKRRPDGSGQLKCSFMVDVEGGVDEAVSDIFKRLATQVLDPLGQDFEYALPLARRELRDSLWFVQEADFSFKDIERRGRDFLANRLLPALQRALPLSFDPVEWWLEERPGPQA
jgi:hypothetical protein